VSKRWKQLANDPILIKTAIYKDIAFGNDKWARCFGADVVNDEDKAEEFYSLPWREYIEDCKKLKKIFPEQQAKVRLMLVRLPKTLNGGLTLNSLSRLAKKYFFVNVKGLGNIFNALIQELGDKSIDKSQWLLMTKDVLPGSRGKSYEKQHRIIARLAKQSLIGYEVPGMLESVTCILSQYFGSKTCLFSENPRTFTRCKEKVEDIKTNIGNFTTAGIYPDSLLFVSCDIFDNHYIGVAAMRKF
jgi:hypothetical protein